MKISRKADEILQLQRESYGGFTKFSPERIFKMETIKTFVQSLIKSSNEVRTAQFSLLFKGFPVHYLKRRVVLQQGQATITNI